MRQWSQALGSETVVSKLGVSLDKVISYQLREIPGSNRRLLRGFHNESVLILSDQTCPPFIYISSSVSERLLYDTDESYLTFKKFPVIIEFIFFSVIILIISFHLYCSYCDLNFKDLIAENIS